MIFYSKSTGGFYDSAIHKENIPDDAIEITDQKRIDLLLNQTQGMEISSNPDGLPISLDRPEMDPRAFMVANAWQMRQAANQLGYRDDIETAVKSSNDTSLQDAWNHWPNFARLHPKVILIATTIGMSEAELDDFFKLATTLKP